MVVPTGDLHIPVRRDDRIIIHFVRVEVVHYGVFVPATERDLLGLRLLLCSSA